jgi:hypothetical protein
MMLAAESRSLGAGFVERASWPRIGEAMVKETDDAYAANLAFYEKLVATNPHVERKGATMPYTSLNGHMFSLLTNEGTMALRLPADERAAFLKKYKTKLSEQYGTVLKEYVDVPDALLKKTTELKMYFDVSYAYVGSLKPKPTTRAKPKTATSKKSNKATKTPKSAKAPRTKGANRKKGSA